MKNDLPDNVRLRSKYSLSYVRGIPRRLRSLAGRQQFSVPLSVKLGDPAYKIAAAAAQAEKEFVAFCDMLEGSTDLALDSAKLDALAANALRKSWARPGDLMQGRLQNPNTDWYSQDDIDQATEQLAEIAVQHIDDSTPVGKEVKSRARRALRSSVRKRTRTLSQLWQDYLDDRGKNWDERVMKRVQAVGRSFLAHTGDFLASEPDALARLHDGMDSWAEQRLTEIKPSSVQRQMNYWLSAMRRASRVHRLGWLIEPPLIENQKHAVRPVMTPEQQAVLVANADSMIGTLAVLGLTCATMRSEIARLDLKKAMKTLAEPIPYLHFTGELKTTARERAVPVMIATEAVVKNLPALHKWLGQHDESNPSRVARNYLRKLFPNSGLTLHSGRHSFRAQALATKQPSQLISQMAGWSVGNAAMQEYGKAAMTSPETLQAMAECQRAMFAHCL